MSHKRNRVQHLDQTFKITIENNFNEPFHFQYRYHPPKKEKHSREHTQEKNINSISNHERKKKRLTEKCTNVGVKRVVLKR